MTPRHHRQQGMALLSAMLTVALVASLASAALWTQWRQVEIETAERGRAQNLWLMNGALDWTRLILAEDARANQGIDHLGEPWALPVQESRLSTFLSQDQQWRQGDPDIYLSGQISDAQSRLNLMSLVENGKPSPASTAAWVRLFQRLDLPMAELNTLLLRWPQALAASQSASDDKNPAQASERWQTAPLLPQRLDQLTWVGLRAGTIERLRPYATVLPVATPVNLNTAPEPVLQAAIAGLDAAGARQAVTRRSQNPWNSLSEAAQAMGLPSQRLDGRLHAVQSRFFEIHGRLRIDQQNQDEQVLVERSGQGGNLQVRMLWRVRSPQPSVVPGSLQ